jgi:hypothetical protein
MTQSRKHAPRVDDELKRGVEGHVQGNPPGGRAEEWREPEPPAEGEPEVTAVPQPDQQVRSDADLPFTPYEIEERSRFTRYLHRGMFPADRREILRAARDAGAPDDLIEDLRRLPTGETFATPARAWAALGHAADGG